MYGKINRISQSVIEKSFYLLFFLVPLILTPYNFELFEYNKMMLTYGLTAVIVGAWLIKTVVNKKIIFRRTPFEIPLLLFLISQIASTVFSIDKHVSLFGYYSRSNGGLLSTISYLSLYFAFVSNFPKEKIKKLLFFVLGSGLIVSIYGILEHFGIDKNLWMQDVQNRVFSTLGQPNWLAAYLAVLIPITIGFCVIPSPPAGGSEGSSNRRRFLHSSTNVESVRMTILSNSLIVIFYLALLFTKSRSGFIGFWTIMIFFSIFLIIYYRKIWKLILILNSTFIILNFIFGCPISQLNRFTLPELIKYNSVQKPTTNDQRLNYGSSIIDVGVTESGVIRQIVWKGALDIFKKNPLFGTGVETFAFAYYRYRPVEHNMTSEWDFLYNKAHNEYLNYLATTGIFGLGSYLLFIGSFIWFTIKSIRYQVLGIRYQDKKNIPNTYYLILNTGLFFAWFSILITNFFGFSVVIIQLLFFLIPAISFVLSDNQTDDIKKESEKSINNFQLVISLIFLILTSCFIIQLIRYWYADTFFATGSQYAKAEDFSSSYEFIKEAIFLNSDEPLYYDEFSYSAAQLATAFSQDGKQATLAAQLLREATLSSDMTILISPANVNFWKTRTRVFYTLSQIDEKYFVNAKEALEMASELSPSDPKIYYNLAIIDDRLGKTQEAFSLLEKGAKLKPDFRDVFFALGVMYEKSNQKVKARENYNYILTKINPNDEEVKKKMEEMK